MRILDLFRELSNSCIVFITTLGSYGFQNVGSRSGGSGFTSTAGMEGDIFAELLQQMLGVPRSSSVPQRSSRSSPHNPLKQNFRQYQQHSPPSTSSSKMRYSRSDATKEVECTLKELYIGCEKRIKLALSVDEGHRMSKEFIIKIKPGWINGTRIRFQESPQFPVAVVFVLSLKPHKYFTLDGSDLVWDCTLSEKQISNGVLIRIPLLNDEDYVLNSKLIDFDSLSGKNEKRFVVKDKGVPIANTSGSVGRGSRYGNLVINFHIK
jgi:DnaJ-class molecular chaperone